MMFVSQTPTEFHACFHFKRLDITWLLKIRPHLSAKAPFVCMKFCFYVACGTNKLIALASDTNLMLNFLIYPFYFAQVPKNKEELAALQARLRKRFPVDAYNKARKELDPHGILSNNKLDKLFPMAETV